MENDIMTSKLTLSELKEILAGVPMSVIYELKYGKAKLE